MIKFEHPEVWGWEHAIRGMRNPMNSWERSDSKFDCISSRSEDCPGDCGEWCTGYEYVLGQNDYDLMARLIKGGQPHRKFLRQIFVSVDITAPLYWWKEFDTYKVGTTANSCSTMHKIQAKEFTLEDFSHEHLFDGFIQREGRDMEEYENPTSCLEYVIGVLNFYRDRYNETLEKHYWWQMIQLLPSSYNQKRTVTMTYENLLNMLEYRRGHKLDEWRQFCEWIFTLPNSHILREGIRE